MSVGSITIADQDPRCGVLREGVDDLLAEPVGGGVRRHIREDETSAFQSQDDEDVSGPGADCRYDEHVDGDDVPGVVSQESGPRLGLGLHRARPDVRQVPGDRALTDDVAQLQELTVDPRSAPDGILEGICRMRPRISARVVGRPAIDFRRQKSWNARRCQAITVAGLTRTRLFFQPRPRRRTNPRGPDPSR